MRLSVALATFNGGRFLAEQLASVAAQSRTPDELVVGDDRSSDDTPAVLAAFAERALFPVRVHLNEERLGSTRNFERAIGRCSGDVVVLCDQDDVWSPEKLARFETAFAADSAVGVVASDLDLIGPDGAPLGRRVWDELAFTPVMRAAVGRGAGPRLWLRGNTLTGAALAFRADLCDVVLPVPPGWIHDAWIAFVAAAVSGVRLLPEPLTRYRSHPGQQIGAQRRTFRRLLWRARQKTAAEFAQVAECFDAAADRLSRFRDRVRDPGLIDLVRRRAAHARVQQRMREGSRVGRFLPAVCELGRGNYHRFGHGLKGFAADLLL